MSRLRRPWGRSGSTTIGWRSSSSSVSKASASISSPSGCPHDGQNSAPFGTLAAQDAQLVGRATARDGTATRSPAEAAVRPWPAASAARWTAGLRPRLARCRLDLGDRGVDAGPGGHDPAAAQGDQRGGPLHLPGEPVDVDGVALQLSRGCPPARRSASA